MAGPNPSPRRLRPTALPAAAVVVVLLLAACTAGGASPRSESPDASPSNASAPLASAPTARQRPFHFALGATITSRTDSHHKQVARRATRQTARAIRDRFNSLYRSTFVNPNWWRDGSYGPAIKKFFDGRVERVARQHLGILTLGLSAGKSFESVSRPKGHLRVNVLIGARGKPVTASVHAWFTERALRNDGQTEVVVSDGDFFVHRGKGGWVIDAFVVRRHDHRLS